ncbi:FecR domain-containing protein [Salibacteraceae bacterium]|nr:FecR domain-containing protein [Salibacteraceae bacterium]
MNEEIVQLIIAELKHSISEADRIKLNSWLEEKNTHKTEYEKVRAAWNQTSNIEHLINIDTKKDWIQVKDRMRSNRNLNWGRWTIAASIALIFGVSSTYYYSTSKENTSTVSLTEYSTGQKQKTVTLEDGTEVILNSNSNLEIHNDFGKKSRTVELTGEAFFEVAKNPDLPFVVITSNSTTKVLGTAFNIKTSLQSTTIQVEHGKVSFSGSNKNLILEKEMSAQSDNKGLISIIQPDLNRGAWRTGILKFGDEPMSNVIKTLQDYYNVPISAEGNLSDYRLTATFDNIKIEQALDEISLIHQLTYQKTAFGFHIKKK